MEFIVLTHWALFGDGACHVLWNRTWQSRGGNSGVDIGRFMFMISISLIISPTYRNGSRYDITSSWPVPTGYAGTVLYILALVLVDIHACIFLLITENG